MTAQIVTVTMTIPVSGGRFFTVVFDPAKDVDFAPLLKMDGATLAQRHAPLFLKPLKENGAGAPLLHSAPLPSHERRKRSPSGEFLGPRPPQKTPKEEIEGTRSAIAELSSEMAEIDTELRPVRAEEEEIRSRILATHRHRDNVVILDLSRSGERAGLFRRLDQISQKWGRVKSQRARLNTQIKSLERDAARFEKAAAKASQRKGRSHG